MPERSNISWISVGVQSLNIGVHQAGDPDRPALVLVHGWPHSGALYWSVMEALTADRFVLAVDLPAIATSHGLPASAEKTVLAGLVLDAVEQCGAKSAVIAGLDVGGMIAFAAARDHSERIRGAIVANTVIPGIAPWKELLANPAIWHFAFHALEHLPETLVRGREATYFDYFIDALAGDPKAVGSELRQRFVDAYSRPEALRAGFDWYRSMGKDAEHNAEPKRVDVPVLYLRGDADGREVADYVTGLRAAGLRAVHGETIPGGEYSPLEAPTQFVTALLRFCRQCRA